MGTFRLATDDRIAHLRLESPLSVLGASFFGVAMSHLPAHS